MKKIILFLIVVTFIWGMSGCSAPSQKPTTNPKSVNSYKNIADKDAASTIDEVANTNNSNSSESLSPTRIPSTSNDKEVQIGFELNSYVKDDIPYTDVNLKFKVENKKKRYLLVVIKGMDLF